MGFKKIIIFVEYVTLRYEKKIDEINRNTLGLKKGLNQIRFLYTGEWYHEEMSLKELVSLQKGIELIDNQLSRWSRCVRVLIKTSKELRWCFGDVLYVKLLLNCLNVKYFDRKIYTIVMKHHCQFNLFFNKDKISHKSVNQSRYISLPIMRGVNVSQNNDWSVQNNTIYKW